MLARENDQANVLCSCCMAFLESERSTCLGRSTRVEPGSHAFHPLVRLFEVLLSARAFTQRVTVRLLPLQLKQSKHSLRNVQDGRIDVRLTFGGLEIDRPPHTLKLVAGQQLVYLIAKHLFASIGGRVPV